METELKSEKYHVVYLTNVQQIVIRTALMDFCGDKMWKTVDAKIGDGCGLDPSLRSDISTAIFRDSLKILHRYESITACMASIDSSITKKGQLFYFDDKGMEWILGALNSYDSTNTYGDKDKTEATSKHIDTTLAHLLMASNFMYTPDEVRVMLRKEGGK